MHFEVLNFQERTLTNSSSFELRGPDPHKREMFAAIGEHQPIEEASGFPRNDQRTLKLLDLEESQRMRGPITANELPQVAAWG